MEPHSLKILILIGVLAIGGYFLFNSGLLPQNVYVQTYQALDNSPLGTHASIPELQPFEGHWVLTFVPTNPSSTFGDCAAFNTIVFFHDGTITGHVALPLHIFPLNGNVSRDGSFSGSFETTDNEYQGTFTGTIAGTMGSGTWQDNEDCRGTWTLAKIAPISA